jgi:hypothetical protein
MSLLRLYKASIYACLFLFLKDIACLGSEADEAGNVFVTRVIEILIFSNISFFFMWKLRFRRFCEAKTPFKALIFASQQLFYFSGKNNDFLAITRKM